MSLRFSRKPRRGEPDWRPNPNYRGPSAVDPIDVLIAKGEAHLRELEAQELAQRAAEIREECSTLTGFIRNAWHVVEPSARYIHGWHIDAIAEHLMAITNGDINRLLINVPPGFMKSLLVGVFWPAFEWGPLGRPGLRILAASYSERWAIRDTGRMLALVRSEWFQTLWPVKLIKEGERKFENDKTGWREGVPIGSLTSGRGDRVVIDDANSTEGAESSAVRARTNRILLESLPSRVNDPVLSAIVAIAQRLHQKDASGTLLSKDLGYSHLMLPMEFEASRRCRTSIGFVDPREVEGELLFPERFPREIVERDKVPLGPYGVAGQFQQRPVPRVGGLFKSANIMVVDALPAQIVKRTRAWDFAGTRPAPGSDPDWTVGARVGKCSDGFFWIDGMFRDRGAADEVERWVANIASADTTAVRIHIPQDPGQAGKGQASAYARLLAGYNVVVEPISGDKEVRAGPFAAQVNAGNVRMLRGPWNDALIEELSIFPNGAHDDVVDALADAFNDVAGVAGGEGIREYYRQEAEKVRGLRPSGANGADELVPMKGAGTAYGMSGRRYDADPLGIYWIAKEDVGPLSRIGFVAAPEALKAPKTPGQFGKYIDYLADSGRNPLPLEIFDEDWGTIGPMVRRDMIAAGVVKLSPDGRGLLHNGHM